MRVVTLNARNPSFDDGENAWPHRREAFFETLRVLNPDVLCLQEPEHDAVLEIAERIDTRLGFAVGREDGQTKGEMCPIFWKGPPPHGRHRGTEWLGDTPDIPGSKAPGAACPRIMTWVDFGDWALINTHLDHIGKDARTSGMAQVLSRADALSGARLEAGGTRSRGCRLEGGTTDKPCLIVGDFNAEPDEPALQLAREAGFVDLADGTGPTYHGFGQGPLSRIDYILARGPWRCERAWVEKGDYSDHWAVVADLELRDSSR